MVLRALVVLIFGAACPAAFAQKTPCDPAAFREAVASASASISSLHEKHGKMLQEHLQKLRVLNKWQDAEFAARAAPYVKDETTASLDAANQALLSEVQSLEAANAGTEPGRCAMLSKLRSAMEKVVANTAARWEHILANTGGTSTQPVQAGLNQ